MTDGPALRGVRVIELGTFISAPFAASLLGDFGADVIKIELPGVGDPMRTLSVRRDGDDGSWWWSSLARNKRSVALDVRTPEGRDLLGRLVETADILIENFRPGTLDRWGIDKSWLDQRNAGLIVVRISGYGQDGPWRDMPGFDRNAQAFSGLVYVTGEKETPPQQCGLPVCDYASGLWAAFGAVTAMLAKKLNNDARGNEVDIALYESMLPFLKDLPMQYRHQGKVAERTGNTPDYVSPGGAYLTGSDEWIFISGTGDRVFKRLMAAIGRGDLAEGPEYQENGDRVTHRAALDRAIGAWLHQRTTEEALAHLQAADVPAIKIQSMADLMTHEQVQARRNFLDVRDKEYGDVCVTAPVPRLAQMAGAVRFPGQRLGAATEEVLQGELNLSAGEMEELRRRGVIG
jgi:formyl-CoA transferase